MGSDTSNITFLPAPYLNLPEWVKFCKETDQSIFLDGGPGFTIYSWKPTGKSTPIIEVSEKGTYHLTVSNRNNCSTQDSIEVREICPPRLYVPTVFTPQQDKNNLFVVSGAHVKKYNLTIFNRWGEIIYYTEDRMKFWDGSYRGESMPIGVYPWLIIYEGLTEEFKGPFKMQGSVTVVR